MRVPVELDSEAQARAAKEISGRCEDNHGGRVPHAYGAVTMATTIYYYSDCCFCEPVCSESDDAVL